jgi:hypothetical protein
MLVRYRLTKSRLLQSFVPIISPASVITADHTSDQGTADKQDWSLLPTRAAVLHARPLHAATQDSLFTCMGLSAQVTGRQTRVHASRCTQDIVSMHKRSPDVLTAVSTRVTGFDTGLADRRTPALQQNLLSACLQRQSVYPSTRCHNTEDHIFDRVLTLE